MTTAVGHLKGPLLAPALDRARNPAFPSGPRGVAVIAGDVLGAVALVLCIPFVILAVVAPVALCIRLLLWMGGLL